MVKRKILSLPKTEPWSPSSQPVTSISMVKELEFKNLDLFYTNTIYGVINASDERYMRLN
jgi:hypothetical protein